MVTLKHENELCLPRVNPRWDTLAELVRDLGCRIVPVGLGPFASLYEVVPPNLVRGEPSSYHCLLLKSGQIAVNAVTLPNVMDAVHEALHHRLGPWSFRHETAMVPIELNLIRRVADTRQRRAYMRWLWHYGLGNYTTVGDLVREHDVSWTMTRRWQSHVRATKRRGYLLNGQLPPAYQWRKMKDYAP